MCKSFGGQKGGSSEPPWTPPPPCLRACFPLWLYLILHVITYHSLALWCLLIASPTDTTRCLQWSRHLYCERFYACEDILRHDMAVRAALVAVRTVTPNPEQWSWTDYIFYQDYWAVSWWHTLCAKWPSSLLVLRSQTLTFCVRVWLGETTSLSGHTQASWKEGTI